MTDNLFLIRINFGDKIISLENYKFIKSLKVCEKCNLMLEDTWSFCKFHTESLKELYLKEVLR